jgi:hypothetical protein
LYSFLEFVAFGWSGKSTLTIGGAARPVRSGQLVGFSQVDLALSRSVECFHNKMKLKRRYSRILGTRKEVPIRAGAFARASSTGREGLTSSSLKGV